jgi:pimeloyl-ACP methyl ester carboxylesterase
MKTKIPSTHSTASVTTPDRSPGSAAAPSHGPLGRIIVTSLTVGAVAAGALTLGLFGGATESAITGSALVAFGASWAMLAVLSTRLTSQPQRWAFVPAAVMTAMGLVLLVSAPSEAGLAVLGWLWPPVMLVLAGWMFVHLRRAVADRRRWLLYPVIAVLGLAALGAAVEDVAQVRDQHAYPMAGSSYDVGGHRLHLDCHERAAPSGQAGPGGPTVILENGLGEMSASWARIIPAVARTTRVCAYDRAGQGWSEEAAHPLDGRETARDLHTLLARAQEHGPFILVGHSTGGTYALTYAAQYPAQVAGLVLLDSSSPDQFTVIPSFAGSYAMTRRAVALLPSLSRLGLARLSPAASALPAPAAAQVRAFSTSAPGLRNVRDEQSRLRDVFAQARALVTLGGKPLAVVTANESLSTIGWAAAQDRLAALSINSSHRIADATHGGLLDDPHGAAVSVRAITDVVRSASTRASLTRP